MTRSVSSFPHFLIRTDNTLGSGVLTGDRRGHDEGTGTAKTDELGCVGDGQPPSVDVGWVGGGVWQGAVGDLKPEW